jgi:hypothetical protein
VTIGLQAVQRRRLSLVVVVLVLVGSVLGTLLLTPSEEGREREAFVPRLGVAFPHFDRPSRPLPSSATGALRAVAKARPVHRGWLILATLSRRMWAVPMTAKMCLVDESVSAGLGVTCTSTGNFLRRGLLNTFLDDPVSTTPAKRSIAGIVPDGVDRVRLHTPGFPTIALPVQDNVFLSTDRIPEPPETVEFVGRRLGK